MITFAGIWFLLKRIYFFAVDNWRVILPVIAALIIFVFVFRFAFCGKKAEVKFDEESLQKINSQIEEKRAAEIERVLVENELVEKSVNDRSAESERKIKEAEEKVARAKESGGNITAQELEKILQESK